ncbi:unnamed protein product [Miscanthus lutarioriparius]|uniref:RING-type domain-containing protein n=1 Tax=Miscanthus lutarioriparius TaxID=422564 RepID=A0A811QBC7_9POAL|nr:unnamed protein product [Miscanthus lutarioriparius]
MFLIMLVAVVAIILLLRFLYYDCRTDPEDQEAAGGGGDRVGQQPQQLESSEAGGGWVVIDRAPASMVAGADVETMVPPVRAAEPPLVCTYRMADGWREGSCGVCLADLQDGVAVRVLPACMHNFHAACIGEWLRAHATCPLCRATLDAPADDAT